MTVTLPAGERALRDVANHQNHELATNACLLTSLRWVLVFLVPVALAAQKAEVWDEKAPWDGAAFGNFAAQSWQNQPFSEELLRQLLLLREHANDIYRASLDAHLAAKKVWAQALTKLYQVQASKNANEKQIEKAEEAVTAARIPFDSTFALFMGARRAEEAVRNLPDAYQAQTLLAAHWAAVNVYRSLSYLPDAAQRKKAEADFARRLELALAPE